MTLSDSFCVDRYRDEFLDLMRSGTVDIVFANEPRDQVALPDRVVRRRRWTLIRKDCKIAAVTRSEKGSVIVRGDETVVDPGDRRSRTGRHDRRRRPLRRRLPVRLHQRPRPQDCGDLGSLAAGLVIQQIGPRPRQNSRHEAQAAGLL